MTLGLMDAENSMLRNIGLVRHRGPSRRKMTHPTPASLTSGQEEKRAAAAFGSRPHLHFYTTRLTFEALCGSADKREGFNQREKKHSRVMGALYAFSTFYDKFAVLKPTSICVTLQSFDEEEFHLAALWMN